MKFKVVEEYENPLLDRRQFKVEIEGLQKTPTREEVLKQFSAKQGLNEKLTVVDSITTHFGNTKVLAYIKSYKNEQTLRKVEIKSKILKWEKIQKGE